MIFFFMKKMLGSALQLFLKVLFSLDKYQFENMALNLCFCYSTYRK